MHKLEQILPSILDQATPSTDVENTPLADACNSAVAQPQISQINVPPQDNSAMDGFAFNYDQIEENQPVTVSQIIYAGTSPTPLTPNTAARIFTGSEIPAGADTVVMQENCEYDSELKQVIIKKLPATGDNIRRQGQDIAIGQTVLAQGTRLKPQDIGMLASIGIDKIPTIKKPTVAIFSTGDELVEPGQALTPGKIYNSNRFLLATYLNVLGCNTVDLGIAKDTLEDTINILEKASQYDCIITSGGVSVGEADFVKQAVEHLGKLDVWKLAIKPGKPLAFGNINNTPFFGLPGNPVAVFVTFLLVVKPFLQKTLGNNTPLTTRKFQAKFTVKRPGIRQHYMRVKINAENQLESFPNQSSGILSSVSWADGLAIIPIDTTVQEGDWLDVILLNDSVF